MVNMTEPSGGKRPNPAARKWGRLGALVYLLIGVLMLTIVAIQAFRMRSGGDFDLFLTVVQAFAGVMLTVIGIQKLRDVNKS